MESKKRPTSPRRLDSRLRPVAQTPGGHVGQAERLRRASRQTDNTARAVPGPTSDGAVRSVLEVASRALAAGDPLTALNWAALRNEAPALALRGIAMAQLGDLVRGKALLRRAARAFGSKDALAKARCIVAEAEIALVSRDLSWPAKALGAARTTL